MPESLTSPASDPPPAPLVDEQRLTVALGLGLVLKSSLPFRVRQDGARRCACGCPDGGKHPDRDADAVTTLAAWRDLAAAQPRRWSVLPMVVTGEQPDGGWLLVLDLDSHEAVRWVECLDLPVTFTVTTGKGAHVYLRLTAQQADRFRVGQRVRTTKLFMHPDTDIKLANSFVVAPGALHRRGVHYDPSGGEIADAPDHLTELLRVGEGEVEFAEDNAEFPTPGDMTLGDLPDHIRTLVLRPRESFGAKPNSRSEGTFAVARWAKQAGLTPDHAEAAVAQGGAGLATRLKERPDDIRDAWARIGGRRPDPRLAEALLRHAHAHRGRRARAGTLALTLVPWFARFHTVTRSREDMATDMGTSLHTAGRARDDLLDDGIVERVAHGHGGLASEFRLVPHVLAPYLRMDAPPPSALMNDGNVPYDLPRAAQDPLAAYVPDTLTDRLQRAVYEALGPQPRSINAVAKQVGSKWETVKKHLVVLEGKGLAVKGEQGWSRADIEVASVPAFGYALAGGRRIERKLETRRRRSARAQERELLSRERRSGFTRDEWDLLIHEAEEALDPVVMAQHALRRQGLAYFRDEEGRHRVALNGLGGDRPDTTS